MGVVFVNSGLRAGKSGNPIVASAGEKEILLHELGHQVFRLADEYCCDGGYWHAEQGNLFPSREECERSTGRQCESVGGSGWWHEAVGRGIMNALENKFFDAGDEPAIDLFVKKYS